MKKEDIEKLKKLSSEIKSDNLKMMENTKELRHKLLDGDASKHSLAFGAMMLNKLIVKAVPNAPSLLADSSILKRLEKEHYKDVLRAEIDIIQAYEKLQDVIADCCVHLSKTAEEEGPNKDISDLFGSDDLRDLFNFLMKDEDEN